MAEMWERFCCYGMRVLLTLYLIGVAAEGDNEAFAIYGAYGPGVRRPGARRSDRGQDPGATGWR